MKQETSALFGQENLDQLLVHLLDDILALREKVLARAKERLRQNGLSLDDQNSDTGTKNLAFYLALREHDLRNLQSRLSAVGMSSLGRGESNALENLDRVITLLARAVGYVVGSNSLEHYKLNNTCGVNILDERTIALFGPAPPTRATRVMVTMPSHAAHDYELVRNLVANGMDCARINCAHDNRHAWARMIENIHRAAQEQGRVCKILMDLAGHKIRVGKLARGAAVRRLKVKKDEFGRVTKNNTVKLLPTSASRAFCEHSFCVPDELFKLAQEGDRIVVADARDKRRYLNITASNEQLGSLSAYAEKSIYYCPDAKLQLQRKRDNRFTTIYKATVPFFSGESKPLFVREGDEVVLSSVATEGKAAELDQTDGHLNRAILVCSTPEVIPKLKVGERVWINDGKLGAIVNSTMETGAMLKITRTKPGGGRINAEKGLNFPDSELNLPPLSRADLDALDFVTEHADMIGLSFVQSAADVMMLVAELEKRDAAQIPVVLKIETRKAVDDFHEILMKCVDRHPIGVMIARGDLAVELGSIRMAEIQEELLWLCEAAHVPVIWATQVLETTLKKGLNSRPEATDAAMSSRAECVMLNKGPHVIEAVETLSEILSRMQRHQHKKSALLRPLKICSSD